MSAVNRQWFTPGAMGLLTPIQALLGDNQIAEILINKPGEVFYEKDGGLHYVAVPAFTTMHLTQLFQLIASSSAQVLNETQPLLSGNLPDGSRVQCVLPPTAKYPTLSIRRKAPCRSGTESVCRISSPHVIFIF